MQVGLGIQRIDRLGLLGQVQFLANRLPEPFAHGIAEALQAGQLAPATGHAVVDRAVPRGGVGLHGEGQGLQLDFELVQTFS
jgi:hypothetical protein